MQSLFEGEEKTVKSFVSEYGMVIVDECHHVAAFTFETQSLGHLCPNFQNKTDSVKKQNPFAV